MLQKKQKQKQKKKFLKLGTFLGGYYSALCCSQLMSRRMGVITLSWVVIVVPSTALKTKVKKDGQSLPQQILAFDIHFIRIYVIS